jgi:hypothetical protein
MRWVLRSIRVAPTQSSSERMRRLKLGWLTARFSAARENPAIQQGEKIL